MAATELVIGCPVWDRAWCLDLWFESVKANVDPARTGLVFVVPSSDTPTREVIARHESDFSWVEVTRDREPQSPRSERPSTKHAALASARNQILAVVGRVQPVHYLSWDSDLLVPPGTVDRLMDLHRPLVTVWTWMNRQAPRRMRYLGSSGYQEVLWQAPPCATAMQWDTRHPGRARHYPAEEFKMRQSGVWPCDVALAFKLMDARAWRRARYLPHHDGEDVPFNWQLEMAGVPRFCCGEISGVHLYDQTATDEIELGWPDVMMLTKQVPLASYWTGTRSLEYEALGFYPTREEQDERHNATVA